MISPKTENLIVKYLTKSANAEELMELAKWIEDSVNREEFNWYVKTHYAITYGMNDIDTDKLKAELLEKIRKDKSISSRFKVREVLKYAAIVILCVSVGYFYQNYEGSQSNEVIPKQELITLELDDGNIKVISEDGESKVLDVNGNVVRNQQEDKIVHRDDASTKTITYNKMNIPYGKRTSLLLSDGTKIQLNAGSSLKYPTGFLEGGMREVYLTGEAYFEVAKDQDSPFIVHTQDLNVEVLGTEFNVSSYSDEPNLEVVLVEGSVNLFTGNSSATSQNSMVLEPGFMGELNKESKSLSSQPVVTSNYTAWIRGELVFRHSKFTDILKRMERHYNVEITNHNVEIANEEFNASFANAPISKILTYLETTYNIDVSIDGHKIEIY